MEHSTSASRPPVQVPTPAVAFVGKQNSGKTTLIEQVIAALTMRGIKVGSVKHHSHAGFDFDVVGKDSWRHRQAGSTHTVIASPDQIASVQSISSEVEVSDIIEMMTKNAARTRSALDLIIVEGYRHGKLPTIELFRSGNPKDKDRVLGCEGNDIVAVVSDMPRILKLAQHQNLPTFGFLEIEQICDFITESYVAY